MAEVVKTIAGRGTREALAALRQICSDEEAKAGDRISAARLLLEYGSSLGKQAGGEALRVRLEGVPPEYLA